MILSQFLSQTIAPNVSDTVFYGAMVWFILDKVIDVLRKKGADPVLAATTIAEIKDEQVLIGKAVAEIKIYAENLDKSHHADFARNDDGSYKWHNAKYITDKIKDIQTQMYETEKKLDAISRDIQLSLDKLDNN